MKTYMELVWLTWGPTTPAEVEGLCRGLDGSKGMGWDGVSPRVVKGVAREVSGSLSRLFNMCIREGHYPACFKVARVVPVFISGFYPYTRLGYLD